MSEWTAVWAELAGAIVIGDPKAKIELVTFTDEPLPAFHTEADMVGVAEAAEEADRREVNLQIIDTARARTRTKQIMTAISAPRDCDGAALRALYMGEDD